MPGWRLGRSGVVAQRSSREVCETGTPCSGPRGRGRKLDAEDPRVISARRTQPGATLCWNRLGGRNALLPGSNADVPACLSSLPQRFSEQVDSFALVQCLDDVYLVASKFRTKPRGVGRNVEGENCDLLYIDRRAHLIVVAPHGLAESL